MAGPALLLSPLSALWLRAVFRRGLLYKSNPPSPVPPSLLVRGSRYLTPGPVTRRLSVSFTQRVAPCVLLRSLAVGQSGRRDQLRTDRVRSILNTSSPRRRAAHKSRLSLSLSLSLSLCLAHSLLHTFPTSPSLALSLSLAHTRPRARTLCIHLHIAVVDYGIDLNEERGSVSLGLSFLRRTDLEEPEREVTLLILHVCEDPRSCPFSCPA